MNEQILSPGDKGKAAVEAIVKKVRGAASSTPSFDEAATKQTVILPILVCESSGKMGHNRDKS
jgi:hypothetical protein